MKKTSAVQKVMVAAMALFLAGTPALHAEETRLVTQNSENKPIVVEAASRTIKGTVDSIDYKTRIVTIKGPKGNIFTVEAGPEITRFDEIKKKDIVKIDYLESTAVFVKSADKTIASAEGSQSYIVRNQGKKPSGEKTETDVITATVVSINAAKHSAELKGPEGNVFKVNIGSDVENLKNVKKGDRVIVRMTRTIALSITKP